MREKIIQEIKQIQDKYIKYITSIEIRFEPEFDNDIELKIYNEIEEYKARKLLEKPTE